jgi:hypothetical protein
MVFQKPKDWSKWVSLAEWWYNTNFHTSLNITPFEALYGYASPQLALGTVPKGNNQAVSGVLNERVQAARILKDQLLKAQNRMKKFADKRRLDRQFLVGDWVYLKLQPYRKISIQGRPGNQKLSPKFYGPFEIVKKMGVVAYELNLLESSLIHPVFHVSQLKKCNTSKVNPSITLPMVSPCEKNKVEPVAILDTRWGRKGKRKKRKILVRWANLDEEEATWEDLEQLTE